MSDAPPMFRDPLQRAVRVLWPSLPMLLVGSILVAVPWALIRLLVPGGGPVAALAVGLLVLPIFATLLHGCDVLLTGDHFGITHLIRMLPRAVATTFKITWLPTGAAALTSVSLEGWQHGGPDWMLVSVAVGGAVTVLAGTVALIAVPYATGTGAGMRESWLVGSYICTRSPVPVLAAASAVALAVWGSSYLSFGLIILLPPPLALVWAAAARQAIDRGTDLLSRRTPSMS